VTLDFENHQLKEEMKPMFKASHPHQAEQHKHTKTEEEDAETYFQVSFSLYFNWVEIVKLITQ
jgi:hypothetical protein